MATGPHRPGFHLGVLIAGFILGGFITALLDKFLPDSTFKQVFVSTWTPTVGPVSVDLLVVNFTVGPVGLAVSVLSIVGVIIAYFVARSLF